MRRNDINSPLPAGKFYFFKNYFRKNKFLFLLTAVIALFVTFASCGDDDDDGFSNTGTKLSISDIAGSWIATSASFSAPENIDLLADGATVTLVIQANGNFVFTWKYPGEPDEVSTGKLGFDGQWLAVRFDDDPDEASFFISLVNNILTLRGQVEFDFDDNGIEDLGILELIMERS